MGVHTHIQRYGLHLPTGEEEEGEQVVQLKGQGQLGAQQTNTALVVHSLPPSVLSHVDMSVEEREELLKQIAGLKEEIASMKSSSLLGEHQPKDIVRESYITFSTSS